MRLLILGGTGFLGPHLIRHALAGGHAVTVFNRGRQAQAWPQPVEPLVGDRARAPHGDLAALRGRDWDVVIDVPASLPAWVRDAARALAGHVGHAIFISSVSAYAASDAAADETAPTLGYPGDPMTETVESLGADRARLYGPLKAASEREVLAGYGAAAATIIRPGLIVGPGDPTDRFTYWPVRLARGGRILAPHDGSDPVQVIDVRDLAAWIVGVAERRVTGVFNAIGPAEPLSVRQMLAAVATGVAAEPELVWAPTEFLAANGVSPWSDLPVWLPGQGATAGFHRRDISRALAQGLRFRPLSRTAADTLAWFRTLPAERQGVLRAGLPAAREAALLAKLGA